VPAEDVAQANQRLRKELAQAQARIRAIESSRWWRLHPRLLFKQGGDQGDRTVAGDSHQRIHDLPVDFDETDEELCRHVAQYTMTTPPRIYALARAVEYVIARGLPGSFVECGVWRGGSMMAVALTLLRLGVTDRQLYLYDTFAGMTPPGDEDVKHSGERASDMLASSGKDSDDWAIASLADVQAAVLSVGYPEQNIHFVEGPIEETIPANAPEHIALLRLDTDWYASTKHALTHLYPRLESGGVLLVDDYAYWQGAKQAVDEYTAEQKVSLLLNRVDYTARLALKP
jgi:O-methyltransferase